MSISISIDSGKCKKDGLCSSICPMGIFVGVSKELPQIMREDMCVLCGQCLAVCPNGAIAHARLELGKFSKISNRQPVTVESLTQLLQQRRSVRNYKDQEIPRDVLEQIVQIAGHTPTGAHGGEGWVRKVVVVSGRANMQRIQELTFEYLKLVQKLLDSFVVRMVSRWKEAPRAGRLMLPDAAFRREAYENGKDVITYNAPAAIFVHTPRVSPTPQVDCDVVLFAMMLVAHSLGLGTCWNGYLAKAASGFKIKSFTALREMLQIPEDHDVYAAATIGYPAIRLHSTPQREVAVRWID